MLQSGHSQQNYVVITVLSGFLLLSVSGCIMFEPSNGKVFDSVCDEIPVLGWTGIPDDQIHIEALIGGTNSWNRIPGEMEVAGEHTNGRHLWGGTVQVPIFPFWDLQDDGETAKATLRAVRTTPSGDEVFYTSWTSTTVDIFAGLGCE